jgi:hypothetical protein
MKVILHTICGCTREIDVPNVDPIIKMPTESFRPSPVSHDVNELRRGYRVFEYYEKSRGRFAVAHYVEVSR